MIMDELIDDFLLLDKMWCFLKKRKALTSTKAIAALVRSAAGKTLTHDRMSILCAVAPDVLMLSAQSEEPCVYSRSASPATLQTTTTSNVDVACGNSVLVTMLKQKGPGLRHSKLRAAAFEKCARKICTPLTPVNKSALSADASTSDASSSNAPASLPNPRKPHEIVAYLKCQDYYEDQIVHVHTVSRKAAEYKELEDPPTHPLLRESLWSMGLRSFYNHQVDAIRAVRNGSHLVLSSDTGSGKSLTYNLPVLESILNATEDSTIAALYMFPTKALAQDQLRALRRIVEGIPSEAIEGKLLYDTLDGDTPFVERNYIRRWMGSSILLTNPDLLHHLLQNHNRWKAHLSNIRYIVLDEAHVYRGVFGTHVALVLRRLLRVARAYGANPQIICCSATIENPEEHFGMLLPRDAWQRSLKVMRGKTDGAARGEKLVCVWNPPSLGGSKKSVSSSETGRSSSKEATSSKKVMTTTVAAVATTAIPTATTICPSASTPTISRAPLSDSKRNHPSRCNALGAFKPAGSQLPIHNAFPEDRARRRSPIFEMAKLLAALVRAKVRTLAFCGTRKLTELVLKYTKDILGKDKEPSIQNLANAVYSYRAGYTKSERHRIERMLKDGHILALCSTNALELGVDIGSLDATLDLGVNSLESMKQRMGRSGRGGKDSLSIVVCFDSPLDQYYAERGDFLFSRRGAPCILNSANPLCLRKHLLCAAKERPLALSTNGSEYERDPVFGKSSLLRPLLRALECESKMRSATIGESTFWKCRVDNPASKCPLRIIDKLSIRILDISTQPPTYLSEITFSRAFFECHKGAIYLYQARQFRIVALKLDRLEAHATPVRVGYYTATRDHTDVDILSRHASRGCCHVGSARVTTRVWGYRKVCFRTRRVFDMCEFTLPPLEYLTRVVWIELPPSLVKTVVSSGGHFLGGVHAASHLLLLATRVHISCDRGDIGTACINMNRQREFPLRLLIF
eukprot:g4383.t1